MMRFALNLVLVSQCSLVRQERESHSLLMRLHSRAVVAEIQERCAPDLTASV